MWKEKLNEIERIYSKYNKKINDGCLDEVMQEFQDEVFENFNYNLPEDYLQFLKCVNGIEFNGFSIYGVDNYITEDDKNENTGYIDSNEIWYENQWQKKYMFLGDSSISWFCYDIENETYVELDKPSAEKAGEYKVFYELLDKVLLDALPSESKKKFLK
ncbi:YrhA family protein [Anaeromicropila populeti]|uniref:SMI1-KNR4 cell-wall n=1 Tax=Anaeromicropila populeti TaxID=37658 RepID=A0A1I6LUD1_9FIRM|nr:YrhA family protein [Anaeromicropila populeti]SFS07081.1 SMI1-KNR4 cell-wall [Anaeromicropila populeti]